MGELSPPQKRKTREMGQGQEREMEDFRSLWKQLRCWKPCPGRKPHLEFQGVQESSEQVCALFLRQNKVQNPASVPSYRRAFKSYVNTCTPESSRLSRLLCEPHLNSNVSREACRTADATQQTFQQTQN